MTGRLLWFPQLAHLVVHNEPTTHVEAISSKDSAKWSEVMNEAPKVRTLSAIKHYQLLQYNLLPKEQAIC